MGPELSRGHWDAVLPEALILWHILPAEALGCLFRSVCIVKASEDRDCACCWSRGQAVLLLGIIY